MEDMGICLLLVLCKHLPSRLREVHPVNLEPFDIYRGRRRYANAV